MSCAREVFRAHLRSYACEMCGARKKHTCSVSNLLLAQHHAYLREQKFLPCAFHKVSSLGGNDVRCTAPIKNLELLSASGFEQLLHFFVLSQLTMMNVKPRTISSIYWYLDGGTLVCKYICTSFSRNESSNVLDKSLNLYHNYLVK